MFKQKSYTEIEAGYAAEEAASNSEARKTARGELLAMILIAASLVAYAAACFGQVL